MGFSIIKFLVMVLRTVPKYSYEAYNAFLWMTFRAGLGIKEAIIPTLESSKRASCEEKIINKLEPTRD